jgi:bleomycin hydrolase
VFGNKFRLDKASRLEYEDSEMTHAMVITGVDLDDQGNPRKWRVENSWGPQIGDKGYMYMMDEWFDQYVYEVVVSKECLGEDLLGVLDSEPIVLPPWDPMGKLARSKLLHCYSWCAHRLKPSGSTSSPNSPSFIPPSRRVVFAQNGDKL